MALAVGYESPQAFTRAFTRFAGLPPSKFRAHIRGLVLDPGADHAWSIVERPPQRVFALRHQGPFSTIPYTHRRLRQLAAGRGISCWLGASFGQPDDPAQHRYFAAFATPDELPGSWCTEARLEPIDLPGGPYARHRLVGPLARIHPAIGSLYARWLPGSGYQPDVRPMLEHYLDAPGERPPSQRRVDLLIPVRPVPGP